MTSNFPSGRSADSELSKLRKENAYLKKTLEELSSQKGEPSDFQNQNQPLLERILELETLRERNSQQIVSRDQEIASLRQQIRDDHSEVVTSLEFQLNQQRQRAEERERQFQCLKKETEDVKNKLAAQSAEFQDLQNTVDRITSGTTDGPSTSRDDTVIQEHLKDALEKNRQWLVYDGQREAYVSSVLNRVFHLEQQLNQTNQELRLKQEEAGAEVKRAVEEQQQQYEELLDSALMELEAERERVVQGRRQLTQLQEEAEEMRQQLQAEHHRGKKKLQEERRRSGECKEHLHAQLEDLSSSLKDERLRSAELQQQIQTSAKDLEDEKRDNHHLQRQLCRVLKELRKAKDRVARLESEKAQAENSEAEQTDSHKLQRSARESQPSLTSPTRAHSLLDESFVECPNCRAQYPTTRHRELLAHIDQCLE